MIQYVNGDMLSSSAEALVNTVNTVGVMGKGIALQFKNRYPKNYKEYFDACNKGTFKTGQVLVVQEGDLLSQKFIINFPTKAHWKGNSNFEYISTGLVALREAIAKYKIKSVALPPLGCGNGGLEWGKVKLLIEEYLKDVDAEIFVFTPNDEIRAVLQKENEPKEAKLTPARAMLLYLLFNYESKGEQCSLFVANKLAYFLQRRGENLRLKFEAHHYGPYAVQLNHVLLYLNGVYLKGLEQNQAKPFEPLQLNYNKFNEVKDYLDENLNEDQRQRLSDVGKLISQFESTFSLELLASVDYIMHNQKTNDLNEVIKGLANWSNRKKEIFQDNHIKIAYEHLKEYAENPFELV